MMLAIDITLEDWFSSIGVTGEFGLFFVSFLFIIGAVSLIILLHGSNSTAMFIGMVSLFVFTTFGWVPEFLLFTLGLLLFGYAFLKIKGGVFNG